jgi:hypothetical protein
MGFVIPYINKYLRVLLRDHDNSRYKYRTPQWMQGSESQLKAPTRAEAIQRTRRKLTSGSRRAVLDKDLTGNLKVPLFSIVISMVFHIPI